MSGIGFSILLVIIGLATGVGATFVGNRLNENNASNKVDKMLNQAKKDAEKIKRDAILEQKEEQHRLKMELDKEIKVE